MKRTARAFPVLSSAASGQTRSTTRRLADFAANFKARFKNSLADIFAAALAKEKKAAIVTGGLEFKPLKKEIKINWLK